MKPTAVLSILCAVASVSEAAAVAEPDPCPVPSDGSALLAGRQRLPCRCILGRGDGVYCGYCVLVTTGVYVISSGRVDNHAYECNPNGACYDYGPRSRCGNLTDNCPGDSHHA